MIFVGKGSIWDSESNSILCKFNTAGLLETEDVVLIKRLKALGYAEAKTNEMVSLYECNNINVDWKEQYDRKVEELKQLRVAFEAYKVEKKGSTTTLQAVNKIIANSNKIKKKSKKQSRKIQAPVKLVEPISTLDTYVFGDKVIAKDYANVAGVKLKSVLKAYGKLEGRDFRRVTKNEAVQLMTELLTEKGLI